MNSPIKRIFPSLNKKYYVLNDHKDNFYLNWFFIEVGINRGKITNDYVCFFIVNVYDLYPNKLFVRVFLIKLTCGDMFLLM